MFNKNTVAEYVEKQVSSINVAVKISKTVFCRDFSLQPASSKYKPHGKSKDRQEVGVQVTAFTVIDKIWISVGSIIPHY